MSKKTKRSKKLHRQLTYPQRLESLVGSAQHLILQGKFDGVINTCEPLLKLLPGKSSLRVEVLSLLGLAHGMLQHYEKSYEIFTEALSIDSTNAELWYNHGLACRYTTRVGQAMRDFEQALELSDHDGGKLVDKFRQELEDSRKHVQAAMQAYKKPLTLEQFIEYEECFMQGMSMIRAGRWQEGEQAFRQLIEMGGGLPQYWGNLGVSLVMQERYDEAEASLKRALEIDPTYTLARNNLEKLPEIRQAGGPLGMEIREPADEIDVKQSIAFFKQSDSKLSPIPHTTLEKSGNVVKSIRVQVGKQPPRHRFFLNPYRDMRFTTCPRCQIKTRPRKFTLIVHVDPTYPISVEKICRYCYQCDLLIVHQDQLEERLAAHFSVIHPEVLGNHYQAIGTLDQLWWRRREQGELSTQEMLEHLHDFKEIVTYKLEYV